MRYIVAVMLLFMVKASFAQPSVFYNVKELGAKADGITLDTKAIDQAIETAFAKGGGTVFFPAGNYLSATIHLKSHVTIYLDQGATIIAAAKGYDLPEKNSFPQYQDYGHSHFNNSLIIGDGLNDIAILGPGRIWGKGLRRDSVSNGQEDGFGNKTISLRQCHNVVLRDFSILHGGWFGALLNAVDNLTIDNVTMDTDRDGIDIISCKNVRVTNCVINSPQDDAICLKSDFALGYARVTENVLISDCQVSGYDEGSLLDGTFRLVNRANRTGRIKLGTESNGGFRNITITNCIFDYSRGLALETVDGAILEDITITNLAMRHIVNSPVFLRLGERMRGPDTIAPGIFRRVIISNIVASDVDGKAAALIVGTADHPLVDIVLTNIQIFFNGGGTKEMGSIEVPGLERDYPEPSRFGRTPSYGFYIRHVRGLRISDIKLSYKETDQRSPIFAEDVEDGRFINIDAAMVPDAELFRFKRVKNIVVRSCLPVADTIIKQTESQKIN